MAQVRGAARRPRAGNDVLLADRALASLTELSGGIQPVFTEGALYCYDPKLGWWTDSKRLLFDMIIAMGRRHAGVFSDSKIESVSRIIKGTVARDDFFATAPRGVAFSNGFLTMSESGTMEIRDKSHVNLARSGFQFDYKPEATCPNIDRTYQQIFMHMEEGGWEPDEDAADKYQLIKEFMGLVLLGAITERGKVLLLVGDTGSNGKSLTINLCRLLFPPEAVSALSPHGLATREYDRGTLAGKKFNVCSEVSSRHLSDSSQLKAVVTGDYIGGRLPWVKPFSYSPIAGHIFGANTLPRTSDHSPAFQRRFAIIRFNRTFSEVEQDRRLIDKLALELPGFAVACLKAAQGTLTRGTLTTPPSAIEEREEWELDSDHFLQFTTECLQPSTTADMNRDILYQWYVLWAADAGIQPQHQLSRHAFTNSLLLACKRWRGGLPGRQHTMQGNRYFCAPRDQAAYERVLALIQPKLSQ